MRKVLTSKFVENVKPPSGGRIQFSDSALPGFLLRVSADGQKSFSLRYRSPVDAKHKRQTWHYPAYGLSEARKEAESIVRAVARGEDPRGMKQAAVALPKTVAELCSLYVERYLKKHVRRWKAAQGEIDNHIVPHIGAIMIEKLTKAHVRAMVEAIEHDYPVAANRVLARVRAIFNWANEADLCFIDPTRGLKKPTKEKPRSRVLSDDELVSIWQACDALENPAREYVRFLILCGQRRDEVRLMRESELDLPLRNWVIPAERYKGRRPHLIPLTEDMIELIEGREGYTFSCDSGKKPYGNLQKPKRRLDKLSGVTGWTLHDIRRTVRTGMSRLGIRPDIAERVIGHSVGGRLGETYDTYSYRDEKLRALQIWEAHVRTVVDNQANVIASYGTH